MTAVLQTRPVSRVKLGVLTDTQIRAFSKAEITSQYVRGGTTEGTPYDQKLGTMDKNSKCITCMKDYISCIGHFGHIELTEPVFCPSHFNITLGILKCYCLDCRMLKITVNNTKKGFPIEIFKNFRARCEKIKVCSNCNVMIPIIRGKEKEMLIYRVDKTDKGTREEPISASFIYEFFLGISNQDMNIMGFNRNLDYSCLPNDLVLADDKMDHPHQIRPEAFLIKSLLVQPTCTRPWIIVKGGKESDRKDDDLTERLNAIIRSNNVIEKIKNGTMRKGKRTITLEDAIKLLQRNVWTLMNNKSELKTAGRSHKGIAERLTEGKTCVIQNNVAAKRSNMTARSVIVGGGTLVKFGHVGCPDFVADKLPHVELILEYNREYYNEQIALGNVLCVRRNGKQLDVKYNTKNFTVPFMTIDGLVGLQVGDIIERKLRDGDNAIFNRQPSLRLESMQGLKIVRMPGELAFRLPLPHTPAFNADQL